MLTFKKLGRIQERIFNLFLDPTTKWSTILFLQNKLDDLYLVWLNNQTHL